MSAPTLPWTPDEAAQVLRDASRNQQSAEDFTSEAYRDYARAEATYNIALAERIVKLRADGVAAAIVAKVAQGDPDVAALALKMHVAEGVRDVAKQRAWRATADRKDAQALSEWSMRRQMAEGFE